MIKRLTPRSLFGRAILIVATPMMLLQIILAIVFFDNHWDNITRRLSLGIAGDIAVLIRLIHNKPESKQKEIIDLAKNFMGIDLTLIQDGVLPPSILRKQPILNIPDRMLYKALGETLYRPYAIDTASYGNQVEILVQLPGAVIRILTSRKRVDSTTSIIFVMWMIGSSLILLAIAIIFLRNQLKPIKKLAKVADALGKGQEIKEVKPSGAIEIRQAMSAFMAMRQRLRRNIEKRTEMLAGVSHDLRTPLTRMKLELAMLDQNTNISSLKADVRDMETMINGYLNFASEQSPEDNTNVNIEEFIQEVVNSIPIGKTDVKLFRTEKNIISLKKNAFKRCLTNLIDNAARYSTSKDSDKNSKIEIRVLRKKGFLEIQIDDNGPGIPSDQYENSFKAFNRLDYSRKPSTVGVGLGLTISRDIARNHGADIHLAKSELGGLRATVKIPI